MNELDAVLARLTALPEEQRQALAKDALKHTGNLRWMPSPGPQTQAYFSKADVLLFGGSPGGGKTALLLGLAFNEHKRSLILRRQYTDISAITDEAIKIHGSRKGFNGSPPPSLRVAKDQLIEFGAAMRIGDEFHWQGNPHDGLFFDEGTQFSEVQVRFLMGWLRSTNPKQRKRVVIATNPPLTSEGVWVLEMFAPWLNPTHPNPAREGELRWFVTDEHGKDTEVDSPEPTLVGEKLVHPLSRTYIHSTVDDNPFLAGTDYQKVLDAMVEPYRSLLLGGFQAAFRDAPTQCIPTDWIRQAQKRWAPNPPIGVPQCAIAADVAQGGDDETILAIRHDGWYAPMVAVPGRLTPLGSDVAGMILTHRRGNPLIIVDMGGGYGGAAYEHLTCNGIDVIAYKGAEGVTTRTKDRQLKFTNKRSEAIWRFREALDPGQEGGSRVALPDDPKLVADLTAPTFEVTPQGIKVEPKEKVCERLGRSTDRGDAVIMAWTAGPKFETAGGEWIDRRNALKGRAPKVLMGRR